MLTVARLATFGALERTESRGTHFRTDYPERNDEDWCAHLEQVPIQEKGGAVERIELRREKVATSDAQGSVHA
jgi:succinate dehydrogenase/fumarate reductase flavoprotein subunit